jgi:uncharacterized protein (DUF1778 family)
MPKEKVINVRCTEHQKMALEAIAARRGVGLSTWILQAAMMAVETEERR